MLYFGLGSHSDRLSRKFCNCGAIIPGALAATAVQDLSVTTQDDVSFDPRPKMGAPRDSCCAIRKYAGSRVAGWLYFMSIPR